MKKINLLIVIVTFSLFTQNINAQTIPTIAEVKNFLSNNHFLVTYKEGGAVYGTYYFVDIHYCASGMYALTGKSIKQTVMGNEQRNTWQEYGSWKVLEHNRQVGIYYQPANAQPKFFPMYRLGNGTLTSGEGVSIVRQGKAMCN